MFAVPMLTQCGTFGAVRTEIDRRIEYRLLPHPDAVLHHRIDCTPDRAMRADGTTDLHFGVRYRRRPLSRFGTLHQRQPGRCYPDTNPKARPSEKAAPVHRWQSM